MSVEVWAAVALIVIQIDIAAAFTWIAIIGDRTPGKRWQFSLRSLLVGTALAALNVATFSALFSGGFH
jgi:hypothetical protein